jgi:hypothetical protein
MNSHIVMPAPQSMPAGADVTWPSIMVWPTAMLLMTRRTREPATPDTIAESPGPSVDATATVNIFMPALDGSSCADTVHAAPGASDVPQFESTESSPLAGVTVNTRSVAAPTPLLRKVMSAASVSLETSTGSGPIVYIV